MESPVGLIGVGKMGNALLVRLKAAGARVRAFDIKESAMQAARDGCAETVASSAEAARGAGIIHVIVHNDDEVIDATLGPEGALAGASQGATIILHSTIMPATTLKVAEAAAKKRVRVVDAPITSVPRILRAGEATYLVGGDEKVVEEIRPHLEALGKAVWYFGPNGAGNAAKLVKNVSNVMERILWIEALTMAQAAGLDVHRYIAMLQSVVEDSQIAQWEKIIRIDGGRVTSGPAAGIFRKDTQHAARLARELGLSLPLMQATADTTWRYLQQWEAEGAAAED